MARVLLRSDTRATEFGHLTSIDLELNSVILELVYLACLLNEHGSRVGKIYLFEYGVEIESVAYQNPYSVIAFFKNVSKQSVDWVLDRTLFYSEEKQKRQATVSLEAAKAEEKHQSVIQKKLENLDKAHKLRSKMIKDGIDPSEANHLIGGLLLDQRATLLLPGPRPDKAA